MSYTLKKLNVVKVVESKEEKVRLIGAGFTLVSEDINGDTSADTSLSELSAAVLKKMAKDAGIAGYSNMSKEALIAALEAPSGNGEGNSGGGEPNGNK